MRRRRGVCNDGTRLEDDLVVVPSPDSTTPRTAESSLFNTARTADF
uniref:Uncharacterized protein n=1 Tax=Peronospora matthiolae TaxID=2874970 RepID=A0AAV1T8V2_9STRA